jgi:hypothetical protein
MQIVNIITLCPSIQMCYVGIASKCFEILESAPSDANSPSATSRGSGHANGVPNGLVAPIDGGDEADHEDSDDDPEDDEDDDDDETEDEGDADGEDGASAQLTDPDATQSEDGAASDDESHDGFEDPDLAAGRVRLRLREILFYDDKVAIFKARHARL